MAGPFSSTAPARPPPSRRWPLRAATVNPRTTALVEGADADLLAGLSGANSGELVVVSQPNVNELQITVSTPYRRFLVVSEPWFPGWQATIDGVPTPIYRADYVLRGVVVPTGQHTVVMRYRPTSVTIGLILSVAMFVNLATLVGWRRHS